MQFDASSRDFLSVYSSICIWVHEVCLFYLQCESTTTEGHATPLQSVTVCCTGQHILRYCTFASWILCWSKQFFTVSLLWLWQHTFFFHHIWLLWNIYMNSPTRSNCTIRPCVLKSHRGKLTGKLMITNIEYHEKCISNTSPAVFNELQTSSLLFPTLK